MLQNASFLAIVPVDTVENESSKVRERDRSRILRNPLTATCDGGTCRPASELENCENEHEKQEHRIITSKYSRRYIQSSEWPPQNCFLKYNFYFFFPFSNFYWRFAKFCWKFRKMLPNFVIVLIFSKGLQLFSQPCSSTAKRRTPVVENVKSISILLYLSLCSRLRAAERAVYVCEN